MSLVEFDLPEELAQRLRVLVASGRDAAITFRVSSRRIIQVRAEEVWTVTDSARLPAAAATGSPGTYPSR